MADDGMQIEAPSIDPPAIMGGGAGGGAVKADQMIDTELLEISPEEFGDRQKIGRGSFGEVFRCQVCRLHTAAPRFTLAVVATTTSTRRCCPGGARLSRCGSWGG
jgi:hypothetical protein